MQCSVFNIIYIIFLPVCAVLFTVLKRGKVKKGKNDLIGAEEGEDPFADISSVGKFYIFSSMATSRSPLTHTCCLFRVDLYNKSLSKSLSSPMNLSCPLTRWPPFIRLVCHVTSTT